MQSFSPNWFTSLFITAYCVSLATGTTLFYYYPLTQDISVNLLDKSHGPAMTWYGHIALAFIVGSIAGLIGKEHWFGHAKGQLIPYYLFIAATCCIIYWLRPFWG